MALFRRILSALMSSSVQTQVEEVLHFERLEERMLLSAGLGQTDKLLGGNDASVVGAVPGDDKYDNNDSFADAYNLSLKGKPLVLANLIALDDDWFKFTTTRTGTEASFVQIGFTHAQGDLELRLFNSSNTELRTSTGTGDSEFISLNGLAAGTYYVRIHGYNGATNPSYDLSIAPPSSHDGEHTLFLNFDGANLSRAELVAWSGGTTNGSSDGQWFAGSLNHFDSNQNGIVITDFLPSLSDREAIIAKIIANVQKDLAKFGIQVVRHFGDAVANVQATTIFLGPSTLSNGYHIACSIDEGNDNNTDIAFVGNEFWDSSADTALALSDVTLHEAGHTFGLYHVSSGFDKESMGLRYNQPDQDKWVANTAFRNEYYQIYPGHGPNREQNSYSYMKATFAGAASSPAALMTASNSGGSMSFGMESLQTTAASSLDVDNFAASVADEISDSYGVREMLKTGRRA